MVGGKDRKDLFAVCLEKKKEKKMVPAPEHLSLSIFLSCLGENKSQIHMSGGSITHTSFHLKMHHLLFVQDTVQIQKPSSCLRWGGYAEKSDDLIKV